MKTPKFDYSQTELYASRYSIYGYCLFIMVDTKNKTFVFGQSNSTVVSLHRAEYRVLEGVTQNQIKELKQRYLDRGYTQLNTKDFI
nr:MAG TPA: MafG, transcription factor, DNA-binding domain [Caudoviricetes sp.]